MMKTIGKRVSYCQFIYSEQDKQSYGVEYAGIIYKGTAEGNQGTAFLCRNPLEQGVWCVANDGIKAEFFIATDC